MAIPVIIHVQGGETMRGEIDELPDPLSNFVTFSNVTTRDGKAIVFIDQDATRVMFPWHRLSFIETLPSEEDKEEIETFFRD